MGNTTFLNKVKPVKGKIVEFINATIHTKEIFASGEIRADKGFKDAKGVHIPPAAIFGIPYEDVPDGFLEADGSELDKTIYTDLYNHIGITYGETNGSGGVGTSHFRIPDYRGAILRGAGQHGTETMATGSPYDGGSIGDYDNDQLQGHGLKVLDNKTGVKHPIGEAGEVGLVGTSYNVVISWEGYANCAHQELGDDGTNGTPRTGAETKPFTGTLKWIIKY